MNKDEWDAITRQIADALARANDQPFSNYADNQLRRARDRITRLIAACCPNREATQEDE